MAPLNKSCELYQVLQPRNLTTYKENIITEIILFYIILLIFNLYLTSNVTQGYQHKPSNQELTQERQNHLLLFPSCSEATIFRIPIKSV